MTMRVRALFVSLVLLTTISLIGCGHYTCGTTFGNGSCSSSGSGLGTGTGNTINVTTYVYFGGTQMAEEGLNFDNSNNFAPISSFVSPTFPGENTAAGPMAVINQTYLYMPFADGQVYAFSIDPATSQLTAVQGSPFTSAAGGSSIAADPLGRFLFVGGASGVTAFQVNSTSGSLIVTGTYATGGGTPLQLATDGLGRYLYAIDGADIAAMSYDPTLGTLTQVVGNPFLGTGFNSLQIAGEKTGNYLFGITRQNGQNGGALDDNIYVFSINSGTPGAPVALTPVPTPDTPAYLLVSPNGQFVYTFNEVYTKITNGYDVAVNPLRGFAVNGGGVLSELTASGSPFTALTGTMGLFDQSGEYIFAPATIPGTTVSGTFAWGVNSTGGVSSTLNNAGVPSANYVVTDVTP
jgi:6-phosphogluconolactonase (cycloisomerase 2 family)